MKVAIAGASGLVGSALVPALRASGHEVMRLVRARAARTADEIAWDPAAGTVDLGRLEGAAAIINLAGESLASGRWTAGRRQRILRSRVEATHTLAVAASRLGAPPKVVLTASGVGYYGDRGDERLSEASEPGRGFLPEVCLQWEREAEKFAALGIRTVRLRFGMILSQNGGGLGRMVPWFRRGLGGRLGSGRQWMSWIAMDDVIGTVRQALIDPRYSGPLNVVAPEAVTNAEFSRALGRALHRPAVVPAPGWALRIAFGRGLADEALLVSQRAAPDGLRALGYTFEHPTVDAAFAAILSRREV